LRRRGRRRRPRGIRAAAARRGGGRPAAYRDRRDRRRAGVAAVLAAGAMAAQLGSAFLLCPEAGTSAAHRTALARGGPTAITRAFSGRRARGLVNRFMVEHGGAASSAYPEIHYVTAPLRAAARERGDADAINLWAGQA